jgi:hypothetical protein
MRAVFFADGEGISLEEVDALCRSLSDVVDLMQLDTGLIIQNLKQVGGWRVVGACCWRRGAALKCFLRCAEC